MKTTELQVINEEAKSREISEMDFASLLDELISFDSGLIIACDSELNPIVEQTIKPSEMLGDIIPMSSLSLHQIIDAISDGPRLIDEQLRSVIGIDPSYSGVIIPLNHTNLQGMLLVLFKDNRLLTDGELNRLKIVAKLISEHYGSLIGLLNKAAIAHDVLDSLNIGIYTVSNKGIMIQFNRAAEMLFRYDAKNIIGRHYLECMAPQQRDNVKRIIDYVMGKKRTYSGGHIRFITLNQEEIVLSSTIFPWLDDNGELLGVVGLVQDETGKHSFQNRLIQLEKMTVINKIATNISQEVQGPLAAIRGFARMIERKESSDANSQKFAQIIVDEVDRINKVVNSLLDLSRPLEMELNLLNLNEVITDTSERILKNKAQIYLNLYLDENLPMIEGNEARLSQLFSNILTNAMESMGQAGVLDIISEVIGGKVKVSIQDNGCGISKSLQDKIFDPFFTTKDDRVGIGLAISRQIMVRHGGWITVRSKENEGTIIMLDFPLARG